MVLTPVKRKNLFPARCGKSNHHQASTDRGAQVPGYWIIKCTHGKNQICCPIKSQVSGYNAKITCKIHNLRHGGYDIRGAHEYMKSALPLDRLAEFVREGFIGKFLENADLFVGACSQKILVTRVAPRWAEMLKTQRVDGMILVPV